MQSRYRLKENRDFRRVFGRGRSVGGPRLVLYWFENQYTDGVRVGFSISKKVGKAVVRNLLKRRLKAIFQHVIPTFPARRLDIVVVCKRNAAEASFSEMQEEVLKLLRKAKIMV